MTEKELWFRERGVPIDKVELVNNELKLAIYDCAKAYWTEAEVIYKNSLMKAIHTDIEIAIGKVPPPGAKAKATPDMLRPFEGLTLDIASNSRTHGHFIFTDRNIGARYFPDNMGRITYGSLLMSEAKQILCIDAKIAVLNEDSKWGQRMGLGDSHGKVSRKMFQAINAWVQGLSLRGGFQFRMGFQDERVAKGTVEPVDFLNKFDFVLPVSCFKGNKPNPKGDKHEDLSNKVAFGVLHQAEKRTGKAGHMFYQWFTKETVDADVVQPSIPVLEQLNQATSDMAKLAEILKLKQDLVLDEALEDSLLLEDDEDKRETDQYKEEESLSNSDAIDPDIIDGTVPQDFEYYPVLDIISVDYNHHSLLARHPHLVAKIQSLLRRRWLRLALNGTRLFDSRMGAPYDQPDLGENQFSARDLPNGKYVVFRNPIRHWGDIRVWENKTLEEPPSPKSTMVYIGTELAAEIAGDFDGDWFQFGAVGEMPLIAQEIEEFPTKFSGSLTDTVITKPEKQPVKGRLEIIAIRSMDSKTGLVADLIAKAQATGQIAFTIKVPNWDYFKGVKTGGLRETPVLEFLAYELQIAVDRLKNDLYHNDQGLETAGKLINAQQIPPWVGDRKKSDVYLSRPMKCRDDQGELPPDSLSYMIDNVNSYWRPYDGGEPRHVRDFKDVFPNKHNYPYYKLPYTNKMRQSANDLYLYYGRQFSRIIQDEKLGEDPETIKRRRNALINAMKAVRIEINQSYQEALEVTDGNYTGISGRGIKVDIKGKVIPASPFDWACAFWDVCHGLYASDNARGGLAFLMFPDIIIEQIKWQPIRGVDVVGAQFNELSYVVWGDDESIPDGEKNPHHRFPQKNFPTNQVLLRFDPRDFKGEERLMVQVHFEVDWLDVGLIGNDKRKNVIDPETIRGKEFEGALYTQSLHGEGSKTVKALWAGLESGRNVQPIEEF